MGTEDWKTDLAPLFNPRSIAILGASEAHGSFTNSAYQYLVHFGYKGRIYPVNPKRDKVWNLSCFKAIKDIDSPVDQVLIGVPARIVPEVLNECGERGIASAIILSSGFAESENEEGVRLQKELMAVAERHKIRVCGPNCIGLVSTKSNTACFSALIPPTMITIPHGRVGYVSQSGTMALNMISSGISNGIGFTYVVSSGNEAVLEVSDYIEFMLRDPDVEVVGAYVEGIKDAKKFFKMADLAARLEKPVLIFKVGKSEKGGQAAASHTGAMAGTFEVYQSASRQKGIILIDSIEQMVESIKMFLHRKPVKKGGLAIIAASGGVCGVLADRSEEIGLSIPDFSPTTKARLKELMPSFGTVHNPLDTAAQTRGEPELFSNAVRVMLGDENIDILIQGISCTRMLMSPYFRPVLIRSAKIARECPNKLLAIISCNTESFTHEINEFIRICQLPVLQGGGIGLKALKHLIEYNRFLINQKELREEAVPGTTPRLAEKWQRILNKQKGILPEKVAKDLLEDYGISVPRRSIVFTLKELKEAASNMGYPIVLKIQSAKIIHKTEAGGVKLNLPDELALSRAFSDLEKLAKDVNSDEGFLLEEMIGSGVEMILGIKKDPIFGPVVMLGLGGVFAELFKDITFRVIPIKFQEAKAMIEEIRGSKLLHGFRGRPESDTEALAQAILRMAHLAQDLSEVISEIEINPLVVLEKGKGVIALDALFVPSTLN